jgi:ATP-dependent exoDNAse (exonuclease V) beta subunit
MTSQIKSAPPDQAERERALDPGRSILVQAPAGSGKTTLLAERFLRLLGEVDEPGQVVAITFTNAAAAEMRNRILDELRKEQPGPLARRALEHSRLLDWRILDLPAQLRITTIDAFCRELALRQPLLSGLGGGLDIAEQPQELYRRAARSTLRKIDETGSTLSASIEALLLWRDNNWQEMEDLLVEMLGQRDRWMHDFVLRRQPDATDMDLEALRQRLERPFANAVRKAATALDQLLMQFPLARDEALELARFGCSQGNERLRALAELADFPCAPFLTPEAIEEGRDAYMCLAELVLIGGGTFRKLVNKRLGLSERKGQLLFLIQRLRGIPGFEAALAGVRDLPPLHYDEDEWEIVRACFTLLRHAAGELQVAFADAGTADFIEVAQIAQRVLSGEDGLPTDAAMTISDGIRHILVDEFQDTSRRQHRLLAGLVAAWPERTGRTCFAVGDPMQSIYFFRDADAELFPRVRTIGLEVADAEPLVFDFVPLRANFRTTPKLVDRLNEIFVEVFAANDGSGVTFTPAEPAREEDPITGPRFKLHLKFVPQSRQKQAIQPEPDQAQDPQATQIEEIVELVRSHIGAMQRAKARGSKYRIAILGRARKSLAPIAEALREAGIPFRAVDLEKLSGRPEVLDALALARALLNPQDRVAWLGVLRAPWCGLTLDDLHKLTANGDAELLSSPVPELLPERMALLSDEGRQAAGRVLKVVDSVPALRAAQPTASLGTWLQDVWLRLGGPGCVDATALANLDLLWSCLDRLPGGEQDLLGPTLDAALDKLTALPDPESGSTVGVQLMTIHKAKGLEFEVVIVPDLQATCGRDGRKMLSWLERGLARPDDSGEITEFLIAPLQSKGADRGKAKFWVDRICRERELQEDRRILYVAATRAREELHFFARPAYKAENSGEFSLAEPKSTLLATAWPALETEVRAKFEVWRASAEESTIESIAASGKDNLAVMPSAVKPTLLRRLPPDYQPAPGAPTNPGAPSFPQPGAPSFPRLFAERVGNHDPSSGPIPTSLYSRHEGGLLSRLLGSAVHAFLEELARLRMTIDWQAAREALAHFEPRITAEIRSTGLDPAQAARIAAEALRYALNVSRDPVGQWILSPHAGAASETSWAGIVDAALRTVRVDRVFRAGPTPVSEGRDCWWIIDYKTAYADGKDPATTLSQLRPLFAPQIEAYATILRNLHGDGAPICAGLYYPRMLLFDWWEI